MSSRATCWLALLLLSGCETEDGKPEGDGERDAAVELEDSGSLREDAGASRDAAVDSRTGVGGDRDWCESEWGNILAPAASGAQLLWVAQSGPPAKSGVWLEFKPDDIEVKTAAEGATPSCGGGRGSYSCSGLHAGDEIVFSFGDRDLTRANTCAYEEDPADVYFGEVACVPEGTVVVEGDLLGYDPARPPPQVTLESPIQSVTGSEGLFGTGDHYFVVGTQCSIESGHYACPTLGFASSATHTVVVGGVRADVALPVTDCEVELVQLDVRCPDRPEGFYVSAPARNVREVTASYEGGQPYPCREVSRKAPAPSLFTLTAPGREYLCPPAPGNESGRGTYRVVAIDSQREYVATVSDVFDGCNGSGAPVTFAP